MLPSYMTGGKKSPNGYADLRNRNKWPCSLVYWRRLFILPRNDVLHSIAFIVGLNDRRRRGPRRSRAIEAIDAHRAAQYRGASFLVRCEAAPSYLLPRSGKTIAQITLSPNATIALEKSHIRATAPGTRAGITTVSPRAHFRISSEAFASLSRKPADTGRQ
jgi:hypothetical protein